MDQDLLQIKKIIDNKVHEEIRYVCNTFIETIFDNKLHKLRTPNGEEIYDWSYDEKIWDISVWGFDYNEENYSYLFLRISTFVENVNKIIKTYDGNIDEIGFDSITIEKDGVFTDILINEKLFKKRFLVRKIK